MDKIAIVLPYPGAETQTPLWAFAENTIDFRAQPAEAARCTLAFAAVELKNYLQRTLESVSIAFTDQTSGGGLRIHLGVDDPGSKDGAFSLEAIPGGVSIRGAGRAGALYGAYEFLRLQGWHWFAPGVDGEIAPPKAAACRLPAGKISAQPSFPLGRGFVFECVSRESAQLLLWMARNRMNLSGFRPSTGPLGEKLCMSPAIGGHLFEPILQPDRLLPSGLTLWEERPEWFGLPESGVRRKELAHATQFCVSQESLMDFLAEELLGYLRGPWRRSDRVDVWGFDTWGGICRCPDCRRLGNGSDQSLHFVSRLRHRIDDARARGTLDHDVRLVLCAYEGTSTIAGPLHSVPENLLAAGDYVTFYPIKRCYAHDFTADRCATNRAYRGHLESWLAARGALPVMIGEYYNVSKYEDLPLLFTRRLAADLPAYHRMGARGMTYMHLPLVAWAMRTLTQALYAQLSWDATTDVAAFLEAYFRLWYGPHAAPMRKAYELLEEAWSHVGQWRNWGPASVLSQLQAWDGATPEQPLAGNDELAPGTLAAAGARSLGLMEEARGLMEEAARAERRRLARGPEAASAAALNPIEAREREMRRGQYERRLGEDRRLLRYGIEVMDLMAQAAAYHNGLASGDASAAESAWTRMEALEEQLDAYYLPIDYEQPGAGLVARDALTRSQLRDLMRRCRCARAARG